MTAIYDGAVKAPVAKGEAVGKLVITAPDIDPVEIPLVAAQPVDRLGPVGPHRRRRRAISLWGKKR